MRKAFWVVLVGGMTLTSVSGVATASPLGVVANILLGWDEVIYYTEPAFCGLTPSDVLSPLVPSSDYFALIDLSTDPGAGTATVDVVKSNCGTMASFFGLPILGGSISFSGCTTDAEGNYACGNPAVINDQTVDDSYFSLAVNGWLFVIVQGDHPDNPLAQLTERISGDTSSTSLFGNT